jgi:superfamily II DNA or RNA helicase
MIKIDLRGSLSIPKNDNNLCEMIKDNLTRTFKMYGKSIIETWSFYIETEEYLHVPRFYPIGDLIGCQIVDKRDEGVDIEIEHNIKPRTELQKKALQYMISNDRGIISLDTGEGKTIIAIAAISELKKKTLILLHRSNLVDQWIKRIEQFTSIKLGKDMAVLKNNKIQKSFEKSIVISTVQTLRSAIERRKKELILALSEARFGILLADEIHTTIGAKKFSECSFFIPSKRVFGLSATPYRRDGTSDILIHHLGPIYKPEGESGIMDARVTIFLFDFGFLPKSKKYIYWGDTFQRSRYLNLLKNSKLLNKICLGLLEKFKDRSVFLISERIKFIESLYKSFNYENKNTFIEKDSNDNLKNQFVFATPGKLRDGIDVEEKDTLILTSPIGNIQQACGRILRPLKDKKIPVVIDLVDIGCPEISETLYYRLKFYKLKNWNIQYFYIKNFKEIIPVDENYIKKLIKPKVKENYIYEE